MGLIEVAFEVPQHVLSGLSRGALQRIGGVIVDASTKQVVMWLRESNILQTATNLPLLPIPNPINWIIGAAQVGASLIDGHFTREAVYDLSASRWLGSVSR